MSLRKRIQGKDINKCSMNFALMTFTIVKFHSPVLNLGFPDPFVI